MKRIATTFIVAVAAVAATSASAQPGRVCVTPAGPFPAATSEGSTCTASTPYGPLKGYWSEAQPIPPSAPLAPPQIPSSAGDSCSGGFIGNLLCSAGIIGSASASTFSNAHANVGSPLDRGAATNPSHQEAYARPADPSLSTITATASTTVASGSGSLDAPPTPGAPIASRLFVPARAKIPSGYGAVALLAFTHPAVEATELERLGRFCRAYLSVLPDAVSVRAEAPDAAQMVTLWPRADLTGPASIPPPKDEAAATSICKSALEGYSFVAAHEWLSHLPPGKGMRARRGPFLIAWAPPEKIGAARTPFLVFDLSNFEQQGAITSAFELWSSKIEGNPRLWRAGWDLTEWRLFTRANLDHFGPNIFAALKIVMPGSKSPKSAQ